MESIQIKNVRSLKDTEEIWLSPITLLVGENSSGKSTFLRLFPLIKQSISKRTDGPLLWAGDIDDYVDFGSFAEALTNDGSNHMTFCFSFSMSSQEYYRRARIPELSSRNKALMSRLSKKNNIRYSITVAQNNGHEFISNLNVQLNQSKFEFELYPNSYGGKITVDSNHIQKITDSNKRYKPLHYRTAFIQSQIFEYRLPAISSITDKLLQQIIGDEPDIPNDYGFILNNRYDYAITIMQFIGQCLCSDIAWDEIRDSLALVNYEFSVSAEDLHQKVIAFLDAQEDKKISNVLADCKLLYFYNYFSSIEQYLDIYFRQVHYIAPLRATAERYYRLRNLAIDEVDYQGKNLAMFLSGLSEERMKQFQEWTQKYFGFHVIVEKSGGHLSVKVSLSDDGSPVNMSDTGFGYSQILPIIVQIWDLSTNPRKPRPYREVIPLVIAIEQPELHLHPALQARLARALLSGIQLAKSNGYQLQLLIETHSETIVNYFGLAIAGKKLSHQDVSVVLFDKDIQTKHTKVKISTYDKDGRLQDWPIGFFAPKEW